MSELTINQVSIQYDKHTIVHDMNLTIEKDMIGCLLGPSGCGKTTLLRAIAGFEPISQGAIALGDTVISGQNTHVAPEKRNIGMVFQDYALFPHMNIADNIAFGIRKQSRKAKQQRVDELLELVSLPSYNKRYPHELSGGQQQRVALARALAPKPKLLLLDEPFGSQDVELRETLAREVREILKQEGSTAILVTHDQHEAYAMADKIGVLQSGRLQQWDTGYNLYHRPVNQFIAEFIGQGALIPGTVMGNNRVYTSLGEVKGTTPLNCEPDCPVDVLIRPDDIRMVDTPSNDCYHHARVITRVFRGAEYLYTLELADKSRILSLTPSHQRHDVGDTIYFELDMMHLVILNKQNAPSG